MNANEILENGFIEGYVLGLLEPDETALVENALTLHPQLLAEMDAVENALQKYLTTNASQILKEKINSKIDFAEDERKRLENGEFYFINKYSDASLWRNSIDSLLPVKDESVFMKTLRDDEMGELYLIKTFDDVANEVHENELESFMVIEGTCSCYIGDKVYNLVTGDFIEIPLHTDHDVKVTSPFVIAIMQRLKLKAA